MSFSNIWYMPSVGSGAVGQDYYRLQTERLNAQAAAGQTEAAQAAVASENARKNSQQQMLYAVLGLSGQQGLLQSVNIQDPRVEWVEAEHRQNRNTERGLVAGMGEAQRNQINRNYSDAQGTALSRLEARGLGASTLAGNAIASAAEARNQSMLNLEESLLNARLDVETRGNQNITGAMENELLRNQQDKQLQQQYASLLGNVFG